MDPEGCVAEASERGAIETELTGKNCTFVNSSDAHVAMEPD